MLLKGLKFWHRFTLFLGTVALCPKVYAAHGIARSILSCQASKDPENRRWLRHFVGLRN